MIDITFGGLFTIELLHKYYADQLCPDFNITVSSKTQSAIGGQRAVVKQYVNKLYAGVQSAGGSPFIPVGNNLQMTFYLWLSNPVFVNYTNLPGAYNPGNLFYFSNRNSNSANGKNFLSAPVSVYSNNFSYAPGDLAADETGNIYIAIHSSGPPAAAQPLTNTSFWASVDNNEYANGNDLLQYYPSISTYNFASPQTAINVAVLGYCSITGAYNSPVFSNSVSFTNPAPSFTLDLSSLQPGKYSLTVNGVQRWIYINDELQNNRPFAVIDIFNAATPASCNLVDGAGKLLSPLYSIYFLNRATLWKYILPATETGTITDNAGVYNFATAANNITSIAPIPLQDQLPNFKLTPPTGNPISPLPGADPQRLASLTQGGDTYACSEIYLNY